MGRPQQVPLAQCLRVKQEEFEGKGGIGRRSFLIPFAIGGLTGIAIANEGLSVALHDTYFVVGHYDYVLSTEPVFPIFAGPEKHEKIQSESGGGGVHVEERDVEERAKATTDFLTKHDLQDSKEFGRTPSPRIFLFRSFLAEGWPPPCTVASLFSSAFSAAAASEWAAVWTAVVVRE